MAVMFLFVPFGELQSFPHHFGHLIVSASLQSAAFCTVLMLGDLRKD
jgi:hypothetical protein